MNEDEHEENENKVALMTPHGIEMVNADEDEDRYDPDKEEDEEEDDWSSDARDEEEEEEY